MKIFINILRWIAILPLSFIAAILSLFLLHLVLYNALTSSGLITPYPEFPEKVLSPFIMACVSIYVSALMAPKYKSKITIALMLIWVLFEIFFLYVSISHIQVFSDHYELKYWGIPMVMGIIGAITGTVLTNKIL